MKTADEFAKRDVAEELNWDDSVDASGINAKVET